MSLRIALSAVALAALFLAFGELASCGTSSPPPSASASSPSPDDVDAEAQRGSSLSAPPTPAASASSAASAASAAAPAAAASSASAGPDRTLDDIRAVVTHHRDAFRACYDESLKSHPGIKGTFTLRFVVNPDGSVKSAEADPKRSDIHTPDLEVCAARAVKKLKFPSSRKGVESTVNYPFDFHPRGSSPKAPSGPP
jgi:TonB family protein